MKTVENAAANAIDALIKQQSIDGRWRDYELPVGSSDEWVTAFIARSLANWKSGRGAAKAAYKTLINHRVRSAGFGYNSYVEADADTTANIILLAIAVEEVPEPIDLEFLRSHERPDGGYATFKRHDGWGRSHTCVTPLAAQAVIAAGAEPTPALNRYMVQTRREDGSWPSYWWPGPFYATLLWLRLAETCDYLMNNARPIDAQFSIPTVMNLAEAAEIALRWDLQQADKLFYELLDQQRGNGLWPPSRTLRVTDDNCLNHDDACGEVYVDVNSLMTTATALNALSALASDS